jgi:hypothetical protein
MQISDGCRLDARGRPDPRPRIGSALDPAPISAPIRAGPPEDGSSQRKLSRGGRGMREPDFIFPRHTGNPNAQLRLVSPC